MRFRCRFGFHRWSTVTDVVPYRDEDARLCWWWREQCEACGEMVTLTQGINP